MIAFCKPSIDSIHLGESVVDRKKAEVGIKDDQTYSGSVEICGQ